MKKVIKFSVEITYEADDDSPICEDSMQDNLQLAIENQRVNGALTSEEISASDVDIEIIQTTESKT